MKTYGLIGYPLTHSWSSSYFARKFRSEQISEAEYKLFELSRVEEVLDLIAVTGSLQGLNVTTPYKMSIIPFLDEIDSVAAAIGAVNCISIRRSQNHMHLKGYNTDVLGFERSLVPFLHSSIQKALVLGTGGASKAVTHVLAKLGIRFIQVSRSPGNATILDYNSLTEDLVRTHTLIINTTPLGMYPHTDAFPILPYQHLGKEHLLFDLIYNPVETAFLEKGRKASARTMNGIKMLEIQAEESWKIWCRK